VKSNNSRGGNRRQQGPRVNEQIRIPECRLIGHDGSALGVVSIDEARKIAEEVGLDLVEVSPNARPPVVKVIDYGKFKYDQQKKANEAKKKQTQAQLKEIQLRPNIESHDLETKLKKVYGFLKDGDKVKLVMQFRGREMAYRDAGLDKFKGILEGICEYGATVESPAKMMGNRIITIIAPDKKLIDKRIKDEGKTKKVDAQEESKV